MVAATSDSEPNELTPTVLPLSVKAVMPLAPKNRKLIVFAPEAISR
jgi:hypothetical protein